MVYISTVLMVTYLKNVWALQFNVMPVLGDLLAMPWQTERLNYRVSEKKALSKSVTD